MELLNFGMYGVFRIQYANLQSKHIWSEKIRRAYPIYSILEYETVAHGIRTCMIDHLVNHENMVEKVRNYARKGLILLPLSEENIGKGFSHLTNEAPSVVNIRSVVARSKEDAEQFLHYHLKSDHVKIGEMLGFPHKSCAFFDKVWSEGYFDPVWQQAENTEEPVLKFKKDLTKNGEVQKHVIRLKQYDDYQLITTVFRYINMRAISHFAYSFSDTESLDVARKWIQLARYLKLPGVDDLLDVLRLPYQWDCYKGIAEITTPVFKLVVNSMPCYPHYVIQQESDFYPKEAPKGLYFPFKDKTMIREC